LDLIEESIDDVSLAIESQERQRAAQVSPSNGAIGMCLCVPIGEERSEGGHVFVQLMCEMPSSVPHVVDSIILG